MVPLLLQQIAIVRLSTGAEVEEKSCRPHSTSLVPPPWKEVVLEQQLAGCDDNVCQPRGRRELKLSEPFRGESVESGALKASVMTRGVQRQGGRQENREINRAGKILELPHDHRSTLLGRARNWSSSGVVAVRYLLL
jgi:hypothetical protein